MKLRYSVRNLPSSEDEPIRFKRAWHGHRLDLTYTKKKNPFNTKYWPIYETICVYRVGRSRSMHRNCGTLRVAILELSSSLSTSAVYTRLLVSFAARSCF